jgi:NAD(P)-dependent dehydrogenase (short-subunit alcohol dehydrogenase family)
MSDGLGGKVAIVTGAGSDPAAAGAGIGQAIATVLARHGAAVLLADRDAERGEATRRCIAGEPGEAVVFVGDVTIPLDCQAMANAACERWGGIDILVNNAAISRHVAIDRTPVELWREVVDVNLLGSFLACQAVLPVLEAGGGGSIVNIGSVAGIRDSGVTHPAYCASKAGQLGLTVDLAGEYGRHNIRVNSVLPGMVATPMQSSFGPLAGEVQTRLNLLGRMGTAWDVAHAVVFLCSDEAGYITGVTLPVDGGATVAMPASVHRAIRSEAAP